LVRADLGVDSKVKLFKMRLMNTLGSMIDVMSVRAMMMPVGGLIIVRLTNPAA